MKIEKHGNKFRCRKTISGNTYLLTFDHKPTQKDITLELNRVMSETSIDAPKDSFESKAIEYLDIKSNVLSPSTIRSYKAMLRSISDEFKAIKLNRITAASVQKEINIYSATHTPKSTRNLHGFISAILGMYRPELILRTTLPQKIKKETYIPTSEDIAKVLQEARGQYIIVFQLGCYGMRRSEVLGLTLDDIEGNKIHINKALVQNDSYEWVVKPFPKNESSTRTIAVSQELINQIKEQGYIYKGHPSKIIENLHRAQDRAGVPRFRFHDLRHYFATEMSKVLPEADWLALGGWASPYVAKKVYRHDRVDSDTLDVLSNTIQNNLTKS